MSRIRVIAHVNERTGEPFLNTLFLLLRDPEQLLDPPQEHLAPGDGVKVEGVDEVL